MFVQGVLRNPQQRIGFIYALHEASRYLEYIILDSLLVDEQIG